MILLNFLLILISFVNPQLTSKILIYLSSNNLQKSTYLAIAIFALGILELILKFFTNKIAIQTKNKISYTISWNLTKKLANATSKSIQKFTSQQIAERITESGNFVNNIFTIFDSFWEITIGIVILGYAAYISLPIFGLFLFVLAVTLVFQKFIIPKQISEFLEQQKSSEQTKSLLSEISNAFLDIKSQNMFESLKLSVENSFDNTTNCILKTSTLENRNSAISSFIQTINLFLFLILGIYLLSDNLILSEKLIALFLYRNYMNSFVYHIFSIIKNFSSAKASSTRMNEIFQYEVLEKDKFGTKFLKKIIGNLSVENVSVQIEAKTILDNVSLTIPADSFVGIVGNSGCGKSTLLKVLAHELQPDNGKVCVDEIDINELNNFSLRRAIRLAPQSPHLFQMSIRDNLKLVNPDANDKDLWHALKIADIADFVQESGGLDIEVNDKSLSGGQKQKLALARLAIQKSKILLLDEATSALDNFSQENIISTILKAKNNHTIIMVAHRLATVKKADFLVFMEQGKILAIGSYDELYKTCPEFRKMADLA